MIRKSCPPTKCFAPVNITKKFLLATALLVAFVAPAMAHDWYVVNADWYVANAKACSVSQSSPAKVYESAGTFTTDRQIIDQGDRVDVRFLETTAIIFRTDDACASYVAEQLKLLAPKHQTEQKEHDKLNLYR
jgi:hypothetical protein